MKKEKKLTYSERLRQRFQDKMLSSLPEEKKPSLMRNEEQKLLDKRLLSAIENYKFWEDIEELWNDGANINIQLEDGRNAWNGLTKIFSAWRDDAFKRNTQWNTDYEKMHIQYLFEISEKLFDAGVNVNCNTNEGHNFLAVVARASLRTDKLNDFVLHLINKGADPYNESGYRPAIDYIKRNEQLYGLFMAITEKKILNKELNSNIDDDQLLKVKRRI